jgi:hypothetical protein
MQPTTPPDPFTEAHDEDVERDTRATVNYDELGVHDHGADLES